MEPQKDWIRMPGLFNQREIGQIQEPEKEYYEEPRGKDRWGVEVFALYSRPEKGGGDGAK